MKTTDINNFVRRNYLKFSDAELAEHCGISVNAVEHRRRAMNLVRPDATLSIRKDKQLLELQGSKGNTEKKYKLLLKSLGRVERERDAALEIKKGVITHKIVASKGESVGEAVAFAIASDWHVEEIVKAEKVNNLNTYNLDVAKKRADIFFNRLERLVRKEQQDVHIKEVVIGLLGDFISGNIHEELLENTSLQPMPAIKFASELIASGLEFLLEKTDLKFTIVCCVGNHSRITKKVHYSTEQENSLEWLMYHFLKQRYECDRMKFIINDSYFTYLEIYDYNIRFHHGHGFRSGGGVGGITIPLNKAIHNWNAGHKATLDVMGHWHQYLSLPHAVINGSMIGYNAFAEFIRAEFERPTQAFFLIDKKRGRTISAPIYFE